jgi:hypothetical protein
MRKYRVIKTEDNQYVAQVQQVGLTHDIFNKWIYIKKYADYADPDLVEYPEKYHNPVTYKKATDAIKACESCEVYLNNRINIDLYIE